MDAKRPSTVDAILKRTPAAAVGKQVREAFEATQRIDSASIMLDVRLADGRVFSFGYAYFVEMEYLPGDRLVLRFGKSEVKIEGRSLGQLREMLAQHKAQFIQEGTEAEDGLKSEAAAHIERISIERPKEE